MSSEVTTTPGTQDWTRLACGLDHQPLVVFDVDGVLADGRPAPGCTARPGVRDVLDILACLGCEIHAWSAGGEEHARTVVETLGLHGTIRACHAKPDEFPMTEASALAVLGRPARLTIDDDPGERVGSWPFFFIRGWYGR